MKTFLLDEEHIEFLSRFHTSVCHIDIKCIKFVSGDRNILNFNLLFYVYIYTFISVSAFYFLFQASTDSQGQGFGNLWDTIMTLFQMTLGEFKVKLIIRKL